MLAEIFNDELVEIFLNSKTDSCFITSIEKKKFADFFKSEKYLNIKDKIITNSYTFSIPKKHSIAKVASKKKRIIYTYNKDEMYILKLFAFYLYKYDYLFSNNLYSFRKKIGVKQALRSLSHINTNKMFGYKIDISNYFNSIDVNKILNDLKNDIDIDSYNLLSNILLNKIVDCNGSIVEDYNKGVMAGLPISAFLANYYLKKLDAYFYQEKIIYFRYADDIIIFDKDENKLNDHIKFLTNFIHNKNLCFNKDKEVFITPNTSFDFLGFSFKHNNIYMSDIAVKKLKAKIRRKSRSIRRWMLNKKVNYKSAVRVMIRVFNKKFYGIDNSELSIGRWYFPFIKNPSRFKEIDTYLQQEIRYIATGRHTKKNYELVPYDMMVELGYKPLYGEYYKYRSSKKQN